VEHRSGASPDLIKIGSRSRRNDGVDIDAVPLQYHVPQVASTTLAVALPASNHQLALVPNQQHLNPRRKGLHASQMATSDTPDTVRCFGYAEACTVPVAFCSARSSVSSPSVTPNGHYNTVQYVVCARGFSSPVCPPAFCYSATACSTLLSCQGKCPGTSQPTTTSLTTLRYERMVDVVRSTVSTVPLLRDTILQCVPWSIYCM